jgi:hypothetical protein
MQTNYQYEYVTGRISRREYLSIALSEASQGFGYLDLLSPRVGLTMRSVMEETFWEMDALDRSETFWSKSNGLPVFSRFTEYVQYQARLGRDVTKNTWRAELFAIPSCTHPPLISHWRTLAGTEFYDPELLVLAAWNYNFSSGAPSSAALVEITKAIGAHLDVRRELSKLVASDRRSEEWAEVVFQGLE